MYVAYVSNTSRIHTNATVLFTSIGFSNTTCCHDLFEFGIIYETTTFEQVEKYGYD
jgi:hypothetical protein